MKILNIIAWGDIDYEDYGGFVPVVVKSYIVARVTVVFN